jgi:dGTPase
MNFRETQEKFEEETLSIHASKAKYSKGREIAELQCDVRTVFQRDRDRILHSKAFRRLAHKTQVFLAPIGDHYRTRLTHTLEVSQIARTISRALRLNEDLTEAIALGHDLGHTPFGHTGERVLKTLTEGAFSHHRQSIRVVEKLENKGKGLNLTFEVKDGILNHPTAGNPLTLEGKVVQISDKLAYVNHDIDDAIRGKILSNDELPSNFVKTLGTTSSQRINSLITDIINNSQIKADIKMSAQIEKIFYEARNFMFENVYLDSLAKEQEAKAMHIIQQLYDYYMKRPEKLPKEYIDWLSQDENKAQVVCDYIAGMTDRYAIDKYCELFVPASWNIY